MDKDEAERLAKAIRLVRMDWIKVEGVEYNASASTFEVVCLYRSAQTEYSPLKASWATLLITNPRQWITILTQRGGGLELP